MSGPSTEPRNGNPGNAIFEIYKCTFRGAAVGPVQETLRGHLPLGTKRLPT